MKWIELNAFIENKEIEKFLEENRVLIEGGQLVVYFVDECHLLWGEVCGYVWGKSNERIELPISNEKERQTYYPSSVSL